MVDGWPFVGRSAQLDQLADLVAARVAILLVGEPGIGKSALAARLGARLAARGAPVATVTGQALSGRVPFEALAPLLSSTAPAGVERTPHAVAAELCAALRAQGPGDPLLVVDDVHRLDDLSVLALHHVVVDRLAGVVLTTSSPQGLPDVVERMVHDGRCRLVELPALADVDLARVLELALGAPVEPRSERTFLRRAQGNPLLLRELLAAAQDAQRMELVDGVWCLTGEAPLGRTVRDLVSARVAELPPEQRAALEAVAATEPLPLGVAVHLVGWDRLEHLEGAGLLTVRDEGENRSVAAAHPVFGDVIRAGLPRLKLLRLRLAGSAALENAADPAPVDLVRAALWRLDSGERGDPDRLLAAARAARSISLAMSERLARAALSAGPSVPATLLLAEVLTHTRRRDEAAALLAGLPSERLPPGQRDAIVYLSALQQGLLGGDVDMAAQLVAGVLEGEQAASDRLQATYASFLAFDARFEEALTAGARVAEDVAADPESRTIAGMGVVGAHYWLGRTRRAVELAVALRPVADGVRDALPYGAPSIELLGICALIDDGELATAQEQAVRMSETAVRRDDPFAAPRAEYCLGRVLLARGQPVSAARLFRRCISALTPFDQTFVRHLAAMLARSEALAGRPAVARAALVLVDAPPDMPPYAPDSMLAEAAVAAAELDLAQAAEQAAYVMGLAASRSQWVTAMLAGHDAVRYGAGRVALAGLRTATAQVDSHLAGLLLDHAEAIASHDGDRLDRASRQFDHAGQVSWAVEAALRAGGAHDRHGDRRAARSSLRTADRLLAGCEELAFPWLGRPVGEAPLTRREQQIATLASAGRADVEIARQLDISVRTVQSHLAHVYTKLGIHGRRDLPAAMSQPA